VTEHVVVTGGLGRAGRWVLDRLHGEYEVTCIDRDHPGDDDRVTFKAADLSDRGETADLVAEADPDAVVHLAAIPNAAHHAPGTVFENNVVSGYNVLEAAGRAGAGVVWTSSVTAYDQVLDPEAWPPERLPVTEDHPTGAGSAYPASKVTGEVVAEMVHRRHGVPVATLRPMLVTFPGEERTRERRESFDPAAASGYFLSYIDARDLAEMVAAALGTDREGHEAFNASAADQYLGGETAAILEDVYGELPADCDLSGDDAVFSVAKARERLGWTPERSWRETEAEESRAPAFGDERQG
jgi:nucleoside-diphosphate-sugar epimerase